ncbi:MAG: hypothetical protein F4Y67_04495 [Chloroflexi bacterium]|nr:hypothetical protein [Chloroflexota bacterium]
MIEEARNLAHAARRNHPTELANPTKWRIPVKPRPASVGRKMKTARKGFIRSGKNSDLARICSRCGYL